MNIRFTILGKPNIASGFLALVVAVTSTACFASKLPTIQIVSGAEQETSYTAAFPKPLLVSVTDQITGQPISGLRVNFTPAAGIGLNSAFAITGRDGKASVIATGLAVGQPTVEASVAGSRCAHVNFDNLVVHKAVLTIVPDDLNSNVGVIPDITSYRIFGFVNGETEETAYVIGTPVLTTIATKRSKDANYAIKGGPGTLSSPNYAFVAGFGTLVLRGKVQSGDLAKNSINSEDTAIDTDHLPLENDGITEVRRALADLSASLKQTDSGWLDGSGSTTQVKAAAAFAAPSNRDRSKLATVSSVRLQSQNNPDPKSADLNSEKAVRQALVSQSVSLSTTQNAGAGSYRNGSANGVRSAMQTKLLLTSDNTEISNKTQVIRTALPTKNN